MRQGFLDVPQFSTEVYNIQEKTGTRIEYSILLSSELISFGKQITDVPLKFASIVLAKPGNINQDFHADSSTGERALVYLTDVDEKSGPIEFESGPVLGKAGTYAFYKADEMHRGTKSLVDRYALALAFDDSDKNITTIGVASCADMMCQPGFRKKQVLPTQPPYDNETCCEPNSNSLLMIAVAIGLFWYIFIKY